MVIVCRKTQNLREAESAPGLLMFRRKRGAFEVLLAHPGGPFFTRKDDGAWTIPKGEAAPGEDFLTRAQIEFEEEVGFRPESFGIGLSSAQLNKRAAKLYMPGRSKAICHHRSSSNRICSSWNGHHTRANTKNFQKSIRRPSFRTKSPDENLSRRRCLFLTVCAPR